MAEKESTTTIVAAEAIEAGGIMRLGDDGMLYEGQRKTANSIEAAEAIEAGDEVEITGELPAGWEKILENTSGQKVEDELEKPVKLPANRTKNYPKPPSNPKYSQAVRDVVAKDYKYLGTNGDGYFYFTGKNGVGAFTLRPTGQLDKVGNKFSKQFLATLER